MSARLLSRSRAIGKSAPRSARRTSYEARNQKRPRLVRQIPQRHLITHSDPPMRFTIRDVLWFTVVVGLALVWFRSWSGWQDERRALMLQRDKEMDNERRLGELLAREARPQSTALCCSPHT